MRYRGLMTCLIVFVMVWTAGLARPAEAGPLIDRVPNDALLYVGWQGANEMADYDESHLAGFLEAVDFDGLLERIMPMVEAEDAADAEQLRRMRGLVEAAYQQPWAIYVGEPSFGDGEPVRVRAAFVMELDEGTRELAARLVDDMRDLQANGDLPPAEMMTIHQDERQLIIAAAGMDSPVARRIGLPTDDAARVDAVASLSDAEAYRESAERVDLAPAAAAIYVDIAGMRELGQQGLAGQLPGEQMADVERMLEASGLAGLERLMWAGGLEQRQWRSAMWVKAPSPRRGVLGWIGDEPLGEEVFAAVPRTAAWFTAGRLDLGRLLPTVREVAADGFGEAEGFDEQLEQGLALVRGALGFDLDEDLLARLGDQWLVYGDMSTQTMMGGGFMLVNLGADTEALTPTLDQLAAVVSQQLAQLGAPFRLQKRELGGGVMHYANTPIMSPGVMAHEDRLYVSLTAQAIRNRVQMDDFDITPITEHEAYAELLERLDAPAPAGVNYADLPRTMQEVMDGLHMSAAMIAQEEPAVARLLEALPTAGQLEPHFTPMLRVVWADDSGFSMRHVSPFPFAEMFSPNGSLGPTSVSALAVGPAVVLPALYRAREAANTTVSASNMRTIYQASLVWEAEKGAPAEDLGVLAAEEYIEPSDVLNPRARHEPTVPDFRNDAALARWVNEHSDYVFWPQRVGEADEGDIVIYERLDRMDDPRRVNIGFGDGRVEDFPFDEAVRLLREAGEPIPDNRPF